MGEQKEEKQGRGPICIGLLAHVDAGKTTLSEGMLYQSGQLKKLGRGITRTRFWTPRNRNGSGGLLFFPSRLFFRWETGR